MRCPSCKADIPGGSKFCPQCGTALLGGCPSCGNTNPASAKFCLECGQRLSPTSVDPGATPTTDTATSLPSQLGSTERRYLTVMFCDLVGSTSISARLDAEEWHDLVGAYLDAASAAVTDMGGHVAKKLGDGIMALFGYPVAQENDAERAVRAALSIQRALCGGEPQECRNGQARAERTDWHRNRPGCGRCGRRDLWRCTQRCGARAGSGGAGDCRRDGACAASDRWFVCCRGAWQPRTQGRARTGKRCSGSFGRAAAGAVCGSVT